MEFRWNPEKDALLKSKRNITFFDLLDAYENDRIVHVDLNTKRTNQIAIYYVKDSYVFVAMCVVEGKNRLFIKTIYPSRKAKKRFLPI